MSAKAEGWPKKLFTTTHDMNEDHEEILYMVMSQIKEVVLSETHSCIFFHAENIQVTTHLPSLFCLFTVLPYIFNLQISFNILH